MAKIISLGSSPASQKARTREGVSTRRPPRVGRSRSLLATRGERGRRIKEPRTLCLDFVDHRPRPLGNSPRIWDGSLLCHTPLACKPPRGSPPASFVPQCLGGSHK